MKTRGITEGAMFCALAVILALASVYVPFLVILMFFIPVPMVVLGQRQGLKVSLVASVAATIIIALLLGVIIALLFGALLLFVGCSLGVAYHRNASPFVKITVGYIGFGLVVIAAIVGYQVLMGVSFTTELFQMLEMINQEVITMYQTTGIMDTNQLSVAKETIDVQMINMKMITPTAMLLIPLVFGFANVAICDGILKRLRYSVNGVKPLAQWQMPKSLKYILFMFLIGAFMLDIFQVTAIPEIYMINIMNLVYLVYFVMGLSLIFDFMEYKKQHNMGLKVVVVLIALLFQFVVTMIGVADTYMEIRKIFHEGSKAK